MKKNSGAQTRGTYVYVAATLNFRKQGFLFLMFYKGENTCCSSVPNYFTNKLNNSFKQCSLPTGVDGKSTQGLTVTYLWEGKFCLNSWYLKPLDCITDNNNAAQNITAHKIASSHLFQDLPEDFRHNYFVSLAP
jgi:hypothetical protein